MTQYACVLRFFGSLGFISIEISWHLLGQGQCLLPEVQGIPSPEQEAGFVVSASSANCPSEALWPGKARQLGQTPIYIPPNLQFNFIFHLLVNLILPSWRKFPPKLCTIPYAIPKLPCLLPHLKAGRSLGETAMCRGLRSGAGVEGGPLVCVCELQQDVVQLHCW